MNDSTVILDGGLATALQRRGLQPATPVDDWIRDRPEEVARVHAAFVAAGANIVLAGTFRTLPHLRADWALIAERAVALARKAAARSPTACSAWASIGPASTSDLRWSAAGFDERAALTTGWSALAARCAEAGAEGFVLETFTDDAECVAATEAIRRVNPRLPVVACLSPGPDGRLLDGSDPGPALRRLREAGADNIGFNCGFGPESIEAAVALAGGADWAKPSSGGQPPEEVVASLNRLARTCRFVGGCCGVSPAEIEALAQGLPGNRPC